MPGTAWSFSAKTIQVETVIARMETERRTTPAARWAVLVLTTLHDTLA